MITPFTIDIPDADLDDLRARLRNTRWPEAELVDDWSQGTPLAYLQEVCVYWADGYDWRSREAALNRFDQFTTVIDDVSIHFIHMRSPHAGAKPLILTHGWPGSVVEFHKVIEALVDPTIDGGDPADAFHVVCPSLPGFGFSGKPTETGWGVEKIADVWDELMTRLGYDRYIAQGGDWGSAVTTAIGRRHPEHCEAVHVTLAMGARPVPQEDGTWSEEEQRALAKIGYYQEWDAGYSKEQATRPQTVGYGLADSPSGQAGWIIEKFWAWTDCDGHPENALSRDEMLDNIMLYWLSNSGASSARIYWQSFGKGGSSDPVTVPAGLTVYPEEIVPPVRRWVEPTFPNIVYWATKAKGGHFAAFEQPEIFIDDIRSFRRAID